MAAPLEQLFVQIRADAGKLDTDLKGALTKFTGFSTGALAAIGGLVAGIGAIGAAAFSAGKEFEAANKIIAAGTGATGDALDDLRGSFENVFGEVPDDAKEVASALANLNTRLNLTGGELEGLTVKVLDASRALDEDGAKNADEFGQALNAFGREASTAGGTMDFLFATSQKFGGSLRKLLRSTSEYGVVLKNAGLSLEESAFLFAKLENSGLSVSRVMPGVNAAIRNMAKAGIDAKDGLGVLIKAMTEAESDTEALNIAATAFGAEGAQRLSVGAREGALSFEGFNELLEESVGSIQRTTEETRTLGDRFDILGNKVTTLLEPLGSALIDGLSASVDFLSGAFEPAIRNIQNAFATLRKFVQPVVDAIVDNLGPAFDALLPVLKDIGVIIGAVVVRALQDFFTHLGIVATFIRNVFVKAIELVTAIWGKFLDILSKIPGVATVVEAGLDKLRSVADAARAEFDKMATSTEELTEEAGKVPAATAQAAAGFTTLSSSGANVSTVLDRMSSSVKSAKDSVEEFANTKSFQRIADEAAIAELHIQNLIDRAEELVPALRDVGNVSTEVVPRVNELSQAFSDSVAAVLELSNSVGNLPAKMASLEPGRALIASLKDELRSAAEQGLAVDDALRLMNEDAIVLNLSLEEQAEIYARLKGVQDETTQSTRETGDAMQDVSTAIDDVSKKLADFALGMTKFRDVALEFARTIIRKIVEGAFKALLDAMFLQDEALTKLIQKWKDFINVLGGAGRAGGRAGGEVGGGGAAGAAGGVANVLTGVANLISGIIGNFQLAKIETTLNAIELNTRQTTRALTGASEILAQQEPVAEGQPGIPGGGQIAGLSADFGPRGPTGPVPPRSPFAGPPPRARPPEPPERTTPEEDAANEAVVETARQGLGVLQVLFEHSDFLQDIRGQLNFVNDSLDDIKGDVGASTNHLQRIADILQPQSGSFGNDLVVITKLDQIAVGITELTEQILGDPIASLRDVTAGITQLFVFERDVANVLRDRQVRLLTTAVDLLRSINNKAGNGGGFSLEDLRQANFRQELSEGVIP